MGAFEVGQMIQFGLSLASQINWLMAIGLLAETLCSSVYFPRFISIPDSPFPIRHSEFSLEPFSESPLRRIVIYSECIV